MRMSDKCEQVCKALCAARGKFKGVGKSGTNTFDRYAYAKLEDYMRASDDALNANGLTVITSNPDVIALDDRATSKGGVEHPVRVKLAVRLVHASGEWIEIDVWGEGQDRSDKAVYKAITGARKYGVACLLGLATTDDPEAAEGDDDKAAQPPAPARPVKVLLAEAIQEWTDLAPRKDAEKFKQAFASIAASKKVDPKTMTDQQAGLLLAHVRDMMARSIEFASTVGAEGVAA